MNKYTAYTAFILFAAAIAFTVPVGPKEVSARIATCQWLNTSTHVAVHNWFGLPFVTVYCGQ